MSKDDCERLLLTLYSENGESIDDFYKRNELEIASNVTDEEAEVISAFHLMQKLDKNLLKIMFPQFNERRIENMRMRGLFDISSEHVASYYSLFGKGSQGDWSLGLSDIVKAFISLIESKELYLNERRMSAFISSKAVAEIFPSAEEDKLEKLFDRLVKNLFELEVLTKDKRRIRLDRKKAFELINLDEIRLCSYIMFPHLDEWVRKKSFYFFHLVKKIRGVKTDEIEKYVNRAAVISGFNYGGIENLFLFCILKDQSGITYAVQDEKAEGPVIISSDYSISFTGNTAPLISLICTPVSIDRVKIYQITKESILNAFSLSYTDDDVISFLQSLADFTISPTLSSRIKIWFEEYSRITSERVLLLRTDEKSAKLIKSIPSLAEYILEEVSPGVFIMDAIAEAEWREILKSSSFDMMSETKGPEFNYSQYESEASFMDMIQCPEIRAEREVSYDSTLRKRLLSTICEEEPMIHKIKEMMILSGILFSKSQVEKKLELEIVDAFNYMEKHRMIERALKDKSLILVVENHSGRIAAGKVEMLESFEEGDHMVLGHKVLSVSRLYRVTVLPACLL